MPTTHSGGTSRGFAAIEAAAIVAVGVLLVTMLLIMGGESRRSARLGEDLAKLRQIGAWTSGYGADNADQYWTFSWKKGSMLSQYPDLNAQAQNSDNDAAAAQAIDILRRVAGREDIAPIMSWIPYILFSHLPLEDYLKGEMPDLTFVSAGDKNRLLWARDPVGFDAGLYQPNPCGGLGVNSCKRTPYGSSFQLATSFYDASISANRITQGATHSTYTTPGQADLRAGLMSSVSHPSQKVHLHDGVAWHFGTRISHFALPELRMPLLLTDGSVQVRASADANPGWIPNQPTSASLTNYTYQPASWEPPTLTGGPAQVVNGGRYRWTRGFLDGRDVGGPEACTGQPGCP